MFNLLTSMAQINVIKVKSMGGWCLEVTLVCTGTCECENSKCSLAYYKRLLHHFNLRSEHEWRRCAPRATCPPQRHARRPAAGLLSGACTRGALL